MPQNSKSQTAKAQVTKDHQIYKSRSTLVIDNFVSGIAWGLGTVIGASLIIALIVLVLTQLQAVPLIGELAKAGVELLQKQ